MRATVVLVLLTAFSTAEAAPRKPPPPSRLSLVQAQCPGVPPGPCSPAFSFATGTAVLIGQRQPVPTCPGQKPPPGGKVTFTKVTKNGAPFTGRLRAGMTLSNTFMADTHNGNCELSGIQIELEALVGDIECRNGKCKGTMFGIGCLPTTCADTNFVTEFGPLVVTDDTGLRLATPGTFVPPAADDVQ